jgi:serine/threonine protein phosphatase PrpC
MWYIADFIAHKGNEREYMEDGYIHKSFILNPKETGYVFGVLDGHGGDQAMKWLRQFVPDYVRDTILHHHCKWRPMCQRINTELRNHITSSGSTLSLVIIIDHVDLGYRICIVHVGDSAVAASLHVAPHPMNKRCTECVTTHTKLTTDHDLSNPKERKRIDKLIPQHISIPPKNNNYICTPHKTKDNMCLNMTRSFGDFEFGDAIQPKPQVIKIQKPLCFITLASDGIWDVTTPKDIALWTENTCKSSTNEQLTTCLMNQRSKKRQHDNFTLGVIFLDPSRFIPWE